MFTNTLEPLQIHVYDHRLCSTNPIPTSESVPSDSYFVPSSMGVSRGCYPLILACEGPATVFSLVKALNVIGAIILEFLRRLRAIAVARTFQKQLIFLKSLDFVFLHPFLVTLSLKTIFSSFQHQHHNGSHAPYITFCVNQR